MNATIERIDKVVKHYNADSLDICSILGFQCISEIGLYKEGDVVVYVRPDSLLPHKEWTAGYRVYSPNRIKAVKLRGEWSEGIIVPFNLLPDGGLAINNKNIGDEVSEFYDITHYEPPTPQDLQAKGRLPFNIPKTDEERFENLIHKLPYGELVDVTLKVDGQSWSCYYNIETDEFGVLGRTQEYKEFYDNNYTNILKLYPNLKQCLISYCKEIGESLCLRGESYGEGIQNMKLNPHSKKPKGIAIYSVYNITDKQYERKDSQMYFKWVANYCLVPHVDIIEQDVKLTPELLQKYSTGIEKVNGEYFEGVVINHSRGSFKVINKYYDSKK
jgi:RNA ligase (TIGR02306 family)